MIGNMEWVIFEICSKTFHCRTLSQSSGSIGNVSGILGGWVLNGTQNNLERRNGDMIDRIGNLNTSSDSAGHQNTPKTTIQ